MSMDLSRITSFLRRHMFGVAMVGVAVLLTVAAPAMALSRGGGTGGAQGSG